MARSTSYILTEEDEAFIQNQLKSGEQSTASEVMREAMRRYREERAAQAKLHALLDAGDRSPLSEGTSDDVFARVLARHRARRKKRGG